MKQFLIILSILLVSVLAVADDIAPAGYTCTGPAESNFLGQIRQIKRMTVVVRKSEANPKESVLEITNPDNKFHSAIVGNIKTPATMIWYGNPSREIIDANLVIIVDPKSGTLRGALRIDNQREDAPYWRVYSKGAVRTDEGYEKYALTCSPLED